MSISQERLAEYYRATKSKARGRLVDAMYDSQEVGFHVSQGVIGSQVSFRWSRVIEAPAWAVREGRDTITQRVELCITGNASLSILLRVCGGMRHDWQDVTMAKATTVLRDPEGAMGP